MKATVGFVGLGQMGKWMALNVLKKGFSLWVYDINTKAVDELVKHGAAASSELSGIGKQCDWIVFSLPDAAVVESVIFEEEGLKPSLSPGRPLRRSRAGANRQELMSAPGDVRNGVSVHHEIDNRGHLAPPRPAEEFPGSIASAAFAAGGDTGHRPLRQLGGAGLYTGQFGI